MEAVIEMLEDVRAVVRVTVSAEDASGTSLPAADDGLSEATGLAVTECVMETVRQRGRIPLGLPALEVADEVDGPPRVVVATLDLRPQIKLPDLGEIVVQVDFRQVDESQVDDYLEELRASIATLAEVGRAAEVGDVVELNLTARVDAEEIPNGSATGVHHRVGSGHVLSGLDDAVLASRAGDSFTIQTKLVGAPYLGVAAALAIDVVKVMHVDLPRVDDAFAMRLVGQTLSELRLVVRDQLNRRSVAQHLLSARDRALATLGSAVDMALPEGAVQAELQRASWQLALELEGQGRSLLDHLAATSLTREEVDSDLLASARERVRAQLLLDELADGEGVSVTQTDLLDLLERRAERSGMTPQNYVDRLMQSGLAATLHDDVRRGKALAILMERVVITDMNATVIPIEVLRGLDGRTTSFPHSDPVVSTL